MNDERPGNKGIDAAGRKKYDQEMISTGQSGTVIRLEWYVLLG